MIKNLALFIGRHVLLVILKALIAGVLLFLAVASLILTIIAVYLGYDANFGFIFLQIGLWIGATFFLCLFYNALDVSDKEDYENLEENLKRIYRGRPV